MNYGQISTANPDEVAVFSSDDGSFTIPVKAWAVITDGSTSAIVGMIAPVGKVQLKRPGSNCIGYTTEPEFRRNSRYWDDRAREWRDSQKGVALESAIKDLEPS